MNESILRLPVITKKVGLSRSTIYSLMAEGRFPRPINIGPRAIGWLASEVDQWMLTRASERKSPTLAG